MTSSGFVRDVRYGWRTLTKNRTFSILAIVTIALAVAANGVGFAVLKAVILDPLPYGNASRLVMLAETDDQTPKAETTSYATARDWAARSRSFVDVATWSDSAVRPINGGHAEMLRGMWVSANFFDTLGVPMYLGRSFLKGEDHAGADDVLILTYGTWVELFGADRGIVGRSIPTVDGSYTVVGILPPDFHPLHMSNPAELPRVFMPHDTSESECRAASCRKVRVIARLDPGVTLAQADAELKGQMRALARGYPNVYSQSASAAVIPLRDQVVGGFTKTVWMLEIAVVLVLVLACANVATLLLARTLGRQSEIAIRAALGAGRGRLTRQLLTEGLLLAIGGGAAGGSCAWWVTRLIARTSDPNVPRIAELAPDASMLLFALAASVLTAITAGVGPAVYASRRSFAIMRTGFSVAPRAQQTALRLLVGAELALAFVLAVAVGLLTRSYERVMRVNPGFDPKNVLTLSLLPDGVHYRSQPERLAYFDAVAERMRAIPGVEDSGYASTLPLSHPSSARVYVRERPTAHDTDAPVLDTYLVSRSYRDVMRIPVLSGREFTSADLSVGERVALISESAARLYFGGRAAIGEHVQLDRRSDDRPWAIIVGIVGDVHQYGLDRKADAAIYLLFAQTIPAPQGWASLVVRSRVPPERIDASVRAAMADVDPLQPVFHLQPMSTYISLSVSQRTFALTLIVAFGALALALATGGVYGVVSYVVEQRTREVGLRLALGASPRAVGWMIGRQILTISVAAVAIGAGIAAIVTRGLSSMLFGIAPLDPATIGGVAAFIIAVAIAASVVPVRRASRIDPMIALRADL